MKPTVLFLTTYRLANPAGGGQLRSHALLNAYKAAGFKTLSMAVYLSEGGPPSMEFPLDVPFPANPEYRMIDGCWDMDISDLLSGKWAASAGYSDASKRVNQKVSVVHAEQVYLFPLAAKLRDSHPCCSDAVLVNGTENIEWAMKLEILSKKALPSTFIEHIISEIRNLEIAAAKGCDISLAVTDTDAEWLRSAGADVVLLASNGVQQYKPNKSKIDHWGNKLPILPWCFYAASAHPPNCSGFLETMGAYYGYVPPDRKIIVAGGVCTLLSKAYASRLGAGLRRSRMDMLGEIDVEDLNAIKSLATLYILPITEGGGSNLKTAEALYSGKRVIATRKAMRGYEMYSDLQSVCIVDSSEYFQHALSSELHRPSPCPELSDAHTEMLSRLTWEHCLMDAITYINNLIR